jgi:restriction endonuclease in pPIWI_RE module
MDWTAESRASNKVRWTRALTASVRAAYAWTKRSAAPRAALREVARMTGVVMEAHGTGQGPTTPTAFIEALHGPLRTMPIFRRCDDDAVTELVLLAGGQLTPDAFTTASEYVIPLVGAPSDSDLMPSWTRMHQDQIRNDFYKAIADTRTQEEYVEARRLFIENPAGSTDGIRHLVKRLGVAPPDGGYRTVPENQVYRSDGGTGWWWPCPNCGWPMIVDDRMVRCGYRPHEGAFEVAAGRGTGKPLLRRLDEGSRIKTPEARSAADARCVSAGVWRFLVVPGSSELRVFEAVRKLEVPVDLWPDRDSFDLCVWPGADEIRVDLKEYQSVKRLIDRLSEKPPAPGVEILLPRTHEWQFDDLDRALPHIRVTTEARFLKRVRKLRESR